MSLLRNDKSHITVGTALLVTGLLVLAVLVYGWVM